MGEEKRKVSRGDAAATAGRGWGILEVRTGALHVGEGLVYWFAPYSL